MRITRGKRLSPSLVLSIIAIFISLGGGAYAALGPGSVGSQALKDRAVTRAKIRPGAVSRQKLASRAVSGSKIANHAISPSKLSPGAIGNAVAYAEVTPTGVDASHSRGISNKNVGTLPLGLYCFRNLPSYGTAIATPVATSDPDSPMVSVSLDPHSQGLCLLDSDATLAVTTENLNGNNPGFSLEPFLLTLLK